jgi:phage terminase large subunit
MRDSLVERDRDLAEGKRPTELAEEPEGYIWDTRMGMKKGEQPVKEEDDAMDALRYMVAYHDLVPNTVSYIRNPWS